MDKKILYFMSFLLIPLISLSLVSANIIKGEVNIISFEEGVVSNQELKNLDISYYFNTGEKITKPITAWENYYIDIKEELFCYTKCNIVPKRIITQVDLFQDGVLLSTQETNIKNPLVSQIINVIVDHKTKLTSSEVEYFEDKSGEKDISNPFLKDNSTILIEWFGKLNTKDSISYEFLFEGVNDFQLNIDGTTRDISQPINLGAGEHNISIVASTDEESNPNILWRSLGKENYEKISQEYLMFETGKVHKIKPIVLFTGISSLSVPESYEIDYSVYPTFTLYFDQIKGGFLFGDYIDEREIEDVIISDIDQNRIPVLLVHGLHGSDEGYGYWNNIPLLFEDYDVWELYYSPANVSNFMTSGLMDSAIDRVLLEGYSTNKVDVVSHSMGGLVTIGYLTNIGKSPNGNSILYDNNIRKYVTIASPIHGSYGANRILLKSLSEFQDSFVDDPEAQAYLDLAVGSEFNWLVSQNSLSIPTENILAITGNSGILGIPDETNQIDLEPGGGNDGLVSVSSASLLERGIPLVVLDDYNHNNERGDRIIGTTFDAIKEINVVKSFLREESISQIESHLTPPGTFYGGDFYISPNNPSSNPFNRGSVIVKITSRDNIFSAKLVSKSTGIEYKLTKFKDLRNNTETDNWYYFSDDDPLMSDSADKYGLTFPKGSYQIYIDDESIDNYVEIKGAQTTMFEINLNPPLPDCVLPTNGMTISQNTIFCSGSYNFSDGIEIISNNIELDCNLSKIVGDIDGKSYVSNKYGIKISGSNVTIKNCEISNYSFGIASYSDNTNSNKLINNIIKWNFRGIHATNRQNIFNNSIKENVYGIVIDSEHQDVLINYNDLFSNSVYNLYSGINENQINALNNWWGILNETGIGNKIFGNVSFIPYSGSPFGDIQCVPNLVNTSSTNWQNISCVSNDKMNQSREWVQQDINNCGLISNQTFYEYRLNQTCDFCIPNKTMVETCHSNDIMTGYYNDTNKCFEKTGLISDSVANSGWGGPCDFCVPDWIENYECLENDTSKISYNDTKSCHSQTNLSSDLKNKPNDTIYSFSCDYDNNGLIGNMNLINTNLEHISVLINNSNNLSKEFKNTQEIIIMDNLKKILEFTFTFTFNINCTCLGSFSLNSSEPENSSSGGGGGSSGGCGCGGGRYLNLYNLWIIKQENTSNSASLVVRGLNLSSQNQTKTIYLDRIVNGTGICIKDDEIESVKNISLDCKGEDEYWLTCPGTKGNYSCNLTANETQYKISGLKHSGVKEQGTYCGDSVCNGGEDYNTCSADCSAPVPPAPPSGGGGGGGGSSTTSMLTDNETVNVTVNESATVSSSNDSDVLDNGVVEDIVEEETQTIWQRILNFFRGEPTGVATTGATIGGEGESGNGKLGFFIMLGIIIFGIVGVLVWHNKKNGFRKLKSLK